MTSYSAIHSKATAGPVTGSALFIFISKDCVEKVSIWNKNVGSGPQINSFTNTIVCVCLDTLCRLNIRLSLLLIAS